jgi:hypothetical protein
MNKPYLVLLLTVEAAVIGLLLVLEVSTWLMLSLIPVVPLTLLAALFLRRVARSPYYRMRRLSPEAILGYRPREPQRERPEELSRRIIERAEEIQRTLLESPSSIQVEMCVLGYRACVNDMITLTNIINEELNGAGPVKRLRLRTARQRAIDALGGAREAMPPGTLRPTRQEKQ